MTALWGCCLEQIRDKPLHIVVALGIEKRIVAHGLLHVDEIKHPHFIPLCFQQLSGITQDLPLWVKHHKAGIALHDIRLGIKSRFARTRTADYKGIEVSAVLVRVVPDLHILRQDFVHLPWGLAVLLGDLLCFPPLGGTVFHAAAVIGFRIVVDEKRKPVNCRKNQHTGRCSLTPRQPQRMEKGFLQLWQHGRKPTSKGRCQQHRYPYHRDQSKSYGAPPQDSVIFHPGLSLSSFSVVRPTPFPTGC